MKVFKWILKLPYQIVRGVTATTWRGIKWIWQVANKEIKSVGFETFKALFYLAVGGWIGMQSFNYIRQHERSELLVIPFFDEAVRVKAKGTWLEFQTEMVPYDTLGDQWKKWKEDQERHYFKKWLKEQEEKEPTPRQPSGKSFAIR